MSTSRVDSNVNSVPLQGPKPSQPPPATPFSQVLSGNNALTSGTQSSNGLVGGPVLAAAIREAGSQTLGGSLSGGGAGAAAGAVAGAAGAPGSELAQVNQLQRESQAFSLQLLNLQQDVQDENRRFTTVSNVLKTAFDTAKAAVNNIRT